MRIEYGSSSGLGANLVTPVAKAASATDAATAAQDAAASTETGAHSARANLLETNFVHAGFEQSAYITGLLGSYKIENEFQNTMQGIVANYSALSEAAAAADPTGAYAERALLGQQAAEAVRDAGEAETADKVGEKLEESREELEKKAQEATEGGNEDAGNGTDATAAGTADAAEASGGGAVAGDAAQASQSAQAAAVQSLASQAQQEFAGDSAAVADAAPQAVTHIDIVV